MVLQKKVDLLLLTIKSVKLVMKLVLMEVKAVVQWLQMGKLLRFTMEVDCQMNNLTWVG
jgi:hypothetical protein